MIIENWFDLIRPMVARWVEPKDWELLSRFEQSLDEIVHEKNLNVPLQVKTQLASQGYGILDVGTKLGGKGRSQIVQGLIQFMCGYHNLDYRDVAHIGHGRMIALHGSDKQRKLWLPKLASGSLVGIAATEEQGGSRIQNAKTTAKRNGRAHYLTGEKVYVSRLKEAAVFVVFFKFEQDETLSAALIRPYRKGVKTEVWEPIGLKGWSWGKIIFEELPITNQDILGAKGQGMAIFKEHFVYYRPMVAMATLGVAAAVLDRTMAHINLRISRKDIAMPRDTTLESLAHHYAGINAGILASLCAIVQNTESTSHSSLWSRAGKAWSVEQSYNAVSDLALLTGAASYRADHFIAKALCDLRGFLFADGIHDALRRSAGRTLMDLPS